MKSTSCIFLAVVCSFTVARAGVINVPAGGDLQGALNVSVPGDTIVLQAGAVYKGSFVLPVKSGSGVITVTTSQASSLPAGDQRVTPSNAVSMASLRSANGNPVINTAAGTKHWVLRGLEMSSPGYYLYEAVSIGSSSTDPAMIPDDITIDKCYIHGDPTLGGKRGVTLNGSNVKVTNSWVSDFKSKDQDAQALGGWTGPGPFTITNNYLEASGENILFGGAAPKITGLIPSDITITGNHLRKPLEWRGQWYVKNLLELKNARRVTIRGNIFENNWIAQQNGFGILFTVRTCEAGDYWWAVVQDVVFENNIVRKSDNGVNILGTDNARAACPSSAVAGQTSNIAIRNNLFEDIGLSTDGTFLQVLSGTKSVAVSHNTVFQGNRIIMADGTPSTGFSFENNITLYARYGVIGTSKAEGIGTLSSYMPGYVFQYNVIIGLPASKASSYPGSNYYPATIADAGFVNYAGKDYHLASSSPYKSAGSDGKDIGADMDLVLSSTASTVSGQGSIPASEPEQSVNIQTSVSGATATAVWTAQLAASAQDQICLYPETGSASLWCSGVLSGTSGSVQAPLNSVAAGTYIFRYVTAGGFAPGTSNAFTYTPEPVSTTSTTDSSASQYSVTPRVIGGGKVAISWTAPETRRRTDFIEVRNAGALVTKTYTLGRAQGSVTMDLPAGAYQLRYMTPGNPTPLAVSDTFTVTR